MNNQIAYWAEVLKALISIDTSVPPGKNYDQAMDLLEGEFQGVGCQTERIIIPPELIGKYRNLRGPRTNLLAHARVPGKPRLLIYTHIDTVGFAGWNGLTPRQEEGKIFGRGAADMKGAIAGLLFGLGKIQNMALLAWDLTVVVTTDEEIPEVQIPQLEYLGQFIEPEGAHIWSLDSEAGRIEVAGLGTLQMDVEIMGRSVHSALSHLGENAVEKACLLVNSLLQLKEKVGQRRSKIPVHPDTAIKSGRMEGRLNINVIQGGWKTNVVPDTCRISLDRRLIPEEDLEKAEQELIETLSLAKGVSWRIRNVLRTPPYAVADLEDPVINRLARILGEETGQTGKFGGMGSFDLPGVAAKWRATVFGLGVFRPESNIHGKDEFVFLQDIEDLSEVAARFLLDKN
ncbi:MAG: M20/M25/M40 family metallo-hydrolase [bacterium]